MNRYSSGSIDIAVFLDDSKQINDSNMKNNFKNFKKVGTFAINFT